MNWVRFKDLVYYLCLAGAMVASWCLTQEATVRMIENIFCHRIQLKHLGKT